MRSMTKTTIALSVLLGATLVISGPVFADEPKAKETATAEKAEKAKKESAVEKQKQEKAESDKRGIREEAATSNKERRMLELKK